MSGLQEQEELVRGLLARYGDLAPAPAPGMQATARTRHRRHRVRQGVAVVASVVVVAAGAVGVGLSPHAGGRPDVISPATDLPTPTASVAPPTTPAVAATTPPAAPPDTTPPPSDPTVFAVAGSGDAVDLVTAAGAETTVHVTPAPGGSSLVVGPSGKYLYWLASATRTSRVLYRAAVTGGAATELATLPIGLPDIAFVEPDRTDSAVAFDTGGGVDVVTLGTATTTTLSTSELDTAVGWTADGYVVVEHIAGGGAAVHETFRAVDPTHGATEYGVYASGIDVDNEISCIQDLQPASVAVDGTVETIVDGCSGLGGKPSRLVRIPAHGAETQTLLPALDSGTVVRTFPLAGGALGFTSTVVTACSGGATGTVSAAGTVAILHGSSTCGEVVGIQPSADGLSQQLQVLSATTGAVLRTLAGGKGVQIDGATTGPSGTYAYYGEDGSLFRVPVAGGAATRLAEQVTLPGAVVHPSADDAKVAYATQDGAAVLTVATGRSEAVPLAKRQGWQVFGWLSPTELLVAGPAKLSGRTDTLTLLRADVATGATSPERVVTLQLPKGSTCGDLVAAVMTTGEIAVAAGGCSEAADGPFPTTVTFYPPSGSPVTAPEVPSGGADQLTALPDGSALLGFLHSTCGGSGQLVRVTHTAGTDLATLCS